MKVKTKRIWEVDFLRGLSVVLMIFDHLMFDFYAMDSWFSTPNLNDNAFLISLRSFSYSWFSGDLRFWGHLVFSCLFVFLVGVSTSFSHSNVGRTYKLLAVAAAVTGVTYIISTFIAFQTIVSGILHCIALSLVFYCTFEIVNKSKWAYFFFSVIFLLIASFAFKFDAWLFAIFSAAGVFLVAFNLLQPASREKYGLFVLAAAFIAVGVYIKWYFPNFDNTFDPNRIGAYILGQAAYGEDYFSLFPHVGFLFLGAFVGKAFYSSRKSLMPKLGGKWSAPLEFVGRHSLLIYVLHQVILAIAVALMAVALGCRF